MRFAVLLSCMMCILLWYICFALVQSLTERSGSERGCFLYSYCLETDKLLSIELSRGGVFGVAIDEGREGLDESGQLFLKVCPCIHIST